MKILKGPKKGAKCVAFTPDSESLAASYYDGSIRLWNVHEGTFTKLRRGSVTPMSLVWAPDGKKLFWTHSPSGYGNVCWTTREGETGALVEPTAGVGSTCLSPNGRTLYAATSEAIRRWDLQAGAELPRWPVTDAGFLAVSSDGASLASTHPHAVYSTMEHHVALWDTATGELRMRLTDCREYYAGVAFSPDGSRLAALGNQTLWLWELPSGRPLAHHPGRKFYTGLAFSPNGNYLATSNNDGVVRFWDGHTGQPVKEFSWLINKVLCVAFSPDGNMAAAGGEFGYVVVWDID